MAYIGKLKLGGNEYKMLDCHFTLRRKMDEKGNPASKIQADLIHISIEGTESTTLIEYILTNQSRPIDGAITIINVSQERSAKEISFRDCYVVEYAENINLNNTSKQAINIRIAAKIIRIGTAEYSNS
jgi:hypothetical protein